MNYTSQDDDYDEDDEDKCCLGREQTTDKERSTEVWGHVE